MVTCETCQLLENSSKVVFSTEKWIVNLAPDQGYLGRCYVTLREHKSSLSDLSYEEWADYADIVRRLERAANHAFGATPFNWACMMNNAYKQETAIPHVHWHFRPRYKKEVIIQGITFTDRLFGHHYDREQRNFVDDETFQAILSRLKAAAD